MSNYGQCNGCGASYGVFKKEHGCKNCRFSFCAKCLTKKVEIPQLHNEKHPVCVRCYNILTKRVTITEDKSPPPPDTYYKRLAELQEGKDKPVKQGNTKTIDAKYVNMAKPDRDIAQRLNNLDDNHKQKNPIPSYSQIETRLQKLRASEAGSSAVGASSGSAYIAPDSRTQAEQSNDLFSQAQDEVNLDRKNKSTSGDLGNKVDSNNLDKTDNTSDKMYTKNITVENDNNADLDDVNKMIADMSKNLETEAKEAIAGLQKDKEIKDKLDEMKKRRQAGGEKEACESSDEDNDEDSDAVLIKILAEAKLDEAMEEDGITVPKEKHQPDTSDTEKVDDPDELPWCCMCNEDADIRCIKCDMDLYCKKCFKKCHRQPGMTDHQPSTYKRPKNMQNV